MIMHYMRNLLIFYRAAFFPDPEMQETLTFAVFAAGFVVRPLGGIIFGNIGDRFGRRTALVMGIIAMAIPTCRDKGSYQVIKLLELPLLLSDSYKVFL